MAAEVLSASVGLAGLLLVFVGFVYAKGEELSNVKRGRQFKNVARFGALLFAALLVSAWFSLSALQGGSVPDYQLAIFFFRSALVVTGVYALSVFFVHL